MRSAFERVLDSVLTYGAFGLTQHDLARLAGTSDATVLKGRTSSLPLLAARPIRFAPEMGLVLAMSFGSESARAGIVDANGVIHYPMSAEPRRGQLQMPPGALFARIRQQAIRVLVAAFADGELVGRNGNLPILGAALALPAPVDREHRLRGKALNHWEWGPGDGSVGRPLNEGLAGAFGAPFAPATAQVMNDCNAAAVAVAFERVREVEPPRTDPAAPMRERTMAMVLRVSGGVGAGMIEVAGDDPVDIHRSRFLKSRVMVGTNGLAGELGHLPISQSAVERLNIASAHVNGLEPIDYDAECSCGRRHHLQALVGWTALARRLGLHPDNASQPLTELLEPFLNPLDGGDVHAAARALEDSGRLIGRALTGPVLALNLHCLTVIGALARPQLLAGLLHARREWNEAFWTGWEVAFEPPRHGSPFVSLRGAGLALLRAHRHRKLRDIAKGKWEGLAPSLDYSPAHLLEMKRLHG